MTAPHDTDAELETLAAALASPKAHQVASTLVNAAAFYVPAHRVIWAAICQLHAADKPVTRILVADHLRTTEDDPKLLEAALRLLPSLEEHPWTPSSVTWHARLVARTATRRAAHAAGLRQQQAADSRDPVTFRQAIDETVTRLVALRDAWDRAEAAE